MNTNEKNNKNCRKHLVYTIIGLLLILLILSICLFAVGADSNTDKNASVTTDAYVEPLGPDSGTTEIPNPSTSDNETTMPTPPDTTIHDTPETTVPTSPDEPTVPPTEEHICTFVVKETVPATCEENGYEIKECACGETQKITYPALMHDFYEKKTNPTCTEDGSVKNICRRCNIEKQVETIKATGHKYGDWVVSKEPTGFENGSKYRVCITCKYKDTASIPKTELYPIVEEGDGYKITITREWYKKAWVYAAHIEFTDYSRFGTSCANGKYKNGYETTSHAHNRLNAILTVNGCYSAPYLDYTVVRSGKIWNGADRNLYIPGVYSSYTGLFQSGSEGKQGTHGITGAKVQQLVDDKLVTDTFCFGPPGLVNGELIGKNEGARAQRTFMGTNGNAGDIWLVVSDGRYNDGESAGLTFYEGMEYLKTKGCTFGIHLDGGGSTTMVYRGHVLNAVKEERAVVDFVYFR